MFLIEILVCLVIVFSQVFKLIILLQAHSRVCRSNTVFKSNVLSGACFTMIDDFSDKTTKNPLCVFCLSPPFSIRAFTRPPDRSAARRLSVRSWRRDGYSVLSVRPRFKPSNRRSSNSLTKYLSGFFGNRKRKTLTIQQILNEVREAWRPTQFSGKSDKIMDEKWNKTGKSHEKLSPVLLRRRLSAPETIMRKHLLAQQRSESQDSDVAQSEVKIYHYRSELASGSDSNLNKKRDSDLMRKTTLLRRLWSHNKPLTNSGSFYEWQRRSSNSLTSIHSSPEHLVKRSLQHKQINRKVSPKHQIYDATKVNNNIDTDTTTTTTPKTTETETSRYTHTSYTSFSENSDSAYTNSRSNFTASSNNNSEIQKDVAEDTETSNQSVALNGNFVNETTQTVGTTNVNVISNVHLSQSTLDLIVNQVMRDVKNSEVTSESNIVQVKQIPSFYLKRKESVDNPEHSHIVRSMISNVGVGSPYTKPPELPQIAVPRYSARPDSSSMEVNMSSGESTDKESDTVSLVDSLEDTSSLRTDPMQNEIVANKSDISLELPDNSDTRKFPSKPTAFFIPIEIDSRNEMKAVSEHLPAKVRNRLARRQQKREEKNKSKQSSSRSDSNYISASENGNHIHYIVDNGDVNLNSIPLPEVNYGKTKKRSKPLLPSIETFRRIKIDKEKKETKTSRKSLNENVYTTKTKTKQTYWPKVRNKNEKLSPLYTSKNEYVYDCGPRRIYHKTEFNNTNKRIEILEIMECVDTSEKQTFTKTKSKIPVLINQKLPKINPKQKLEKPVFLDMDSVPITDPKLDQLIANILIETLNMPETNEAKPPPKPSPKYYQKFEVIPEELSFQSSVENDISNNNETKETKTEDKKFYQGKAAVAVVKDENFSSIPKGWITFYMLHNNRGSPDSTSDEGKKLDDNESKICKQFDNKNDAEFGKIHRDLDSAYSNVTYDVVKKEKTSYENENCSSSSDINSKTILPPANISGRYKKYSHQRKIKHKFGNEIEKNKLGDWSVTVSGTNSYGQFAPDLEMCLKFPETQPNYYCPSQSDSGLGEDNEQKSNFTKITRDQEDTRTKIQTEHEDIYMKQRLPEIDRTKSIKKQRRSDSSIPSLSSRIEPRQTRTSTRRYNLTRPKIDYSKMDTPRNAISILNDSHYAEILKRFPEILSITGNAINGKK